MITKKKFIDNIKTLFYAFVIAIIIRSLIIQPFYIPSSSMEPTLLVGDRIFVSKYSYGYSKNSFPFSPPIFDNRIFFSKPTRGDVVVLCKLHMPKKFDKATRKSLEQLRGSLSGTKDVVDRIIDDASERRG